MPLITFLHEFITPWTPCNLVFISNIIRTFFFYFFSGSINTHFFLCFAGVGGARPFLFLVFKFLIQAFSLFLNTFRGYVIQYGGLCYSFCQLFD